MTMRYRACDLSSLLADSQSIATAIPCTSELALYVFLTFLTWTLQWERRAASWQPPQAPSALPRPRRPPPRLLNLHRVPNCHRRPSLRRRQRSLRRPHRSTALWLVTHSSRTRRAAPRP
jgi:hypothetical protein